MEKTRELPPSTVKPAVDSRRSSITAMVDPTPENHGSSERGDPQDDPEEASGGAAGVKDGSVFMVEWDGPEDPSNPKKYVRPSRSLRAYSMC